MHVSSRYPAPNAGFSSATSSLIVPKVASAPSDILHTRPGLLPGHSTIATTKTLSPSAPQTTSSGDPSYVRSAVRAVSEAQCAAGLFGAAASRQVVTGTAPAARTGAASFAWWTVAESIERSA